MSQGGGPVVMAIDLGTSSIKVALLDERLGVVARTTIKQRLLSDATGRREHRVADMIGRTRTAVRRLIASGDHRIAAISVSGPRGSFAITDRHGSARTGLITWQDTRAAGLAARLAIEAGPAYRKIAGTGFEPSVVLPKLAWLRAEQPALLGPGWRLATPQAIILAELGVDDFVVDLTVAAHVGLLDVRALAWSEPLLEAYAVERSALPRLVDPGAVVGRASERARDRWGIAAGTPLLAAASDGVCSELGAGVIDFQQLYAYLGTASTVAGPVPLDSPAPGPGLILMPGSQRDRLRLLGLAKAGGSAADWWRTIIGVRSFAAFDRLVESVEPGAGGVLFVPTLAGASAPSPDGRARGMFVGLTLGASRADLARAVFEGVAIEMRWMCKAMQLAPRPIELRLTGGGGQSAVWSQILADAFQVPIARVCDPDPGLRGAAAYGWSAVAPGRSAIAVARAAAPELDRFEPRRAFAGRYDDLAGRYAAVREAFGREGLDDRLSRPLTLPGLAR